MKILPGFVDMAHTPEDIKEEYAERDTFPVPRYPYGLSICFGNDELEKLGLDTDVEVGDQLYLDCIVKVTGCSSNEVVVDGVPKTNRRVEMIISHIAVEDAEEEASEHMRRKVDLGKLYNAD